MIATLMPSIIAIIGKAIDKAIPDKTKAEELKLQITMAAMQQDSTELKGAIDVILAEANGESWLQRSWRPLLMVWFAGLVGAHWLGFTPDNLDKEVVEKLLTIVQIGIGGYVLGRSGEKIVREWKKD